MKNASICKSECGTWYVIAHGEDDDDYSVVYEGYRKKDCVLWMKEHMNVAA